jgi:hypothetical protein
VGRAQLSILEIHRRFRMLRLKPEASIKNGGFKRMTRIERMHEQ